MSGIQLALRNLRSLHGEIRIVEFGPPSLKTIMAELVRRDLARNIVKKKIETLMAIQTVPGQKTGCHHARETERTKHVAKMISEALIDHLVPHAA